MCSSRPQFQRWTSPFLPGTENQPNRIFISHFKSIAALIQYIVDVPPLAENEFKSNIGFSEFKEIQPKVYAEAYSNKLKKLLKLQTLLVDDFRDSKIAMFDCDNF